MSHRYQLFRYLFTKTQNTKTLKTRALKLPPLNEDKDDLDANLSRSAQINTVVQVITG